jgi:hypothetical protein
MLKCFVDDNFGFSKKGDLMWYEPYQKRMPREQARLLYLWDELGIPHEERKQISGPVIPCLGFDVDPNKMTVFMSIDKRASIIEACSRFAQSGSSHPLRDFWQMEGYLNWAFNVYPLLRPCLSAMYAKTAGKNKPYAPIWINNQIVREISWFINHVKVSTGVSMLKSIEWMPSDRVDTLTAYTDASKDGLGVWFPSEGIGFQATTPVGVKVDLSYFCEALAVCCALHLGIRWPQARRVLIFTDNLDTFSMFNRMRASPGYNSILMSAVDVLIDANLDFRVNHIPGKDNFVADALSRFRNLKLKAVCPHIKIQSFLPPRDVLGEINK